MPSLKMKTKSTSGCLNDKNGLHVCRKSNMISKNPLSCAIISQNAKVGMCNQTSENGCEKSFHEDIEGNYVNHYPSSTGEKLLHKLPSSETDTTIPDSAEPALSTCTSNVETIFSPILESIDIQNSGEHDHLYIPQLDNEDSDDSCRSSFEHQACNISDFYISDMIFSGSHIGNNSVLDTRTDTMFLPDYRFEENSLLCDLTDECMVPFLDLDEILNTGHDHRPSEEATNAGNSSLYMAIHQLRSYDQESHLNTYLDADYESFDPHMYIRNLPDQHESAFNLLPSVIPNAKQIDKRITLVLDLDETLVHSTLDQWESADFTFPVFFNEKEHTVYVKRRPHLQSFLERVAKMFEITIFTASQSIYAKQLLDILDPDGKLISGRAYRESCLLSEGCYLKDLTVLGVDLAKVAIIDNCPQVFSLQVNNGIPIKSWFDDPSDCALISLLPFLETLVDADDVRPIIARKFGNKE